MADLLDLGKEVFRWSEADVAFAKFSAGNDFGLQLVVISEKKPLTDRDFPARPDKAFPVIGIGLQLTCQQDFYASAKEVAGCRIARAEDLRLKTSAASIEACWEHPSVVENDEVAGPEETRKVAELTVRTSAGCDGKVEKAR